MAEVRLGGSSGPVVLREGACWGLPECRGGYPGGGINPARVSRCGGGGSGRWLPPSPRSQAFTARALGPPLVPPSRGVQVARRPPLLRPSISRAMAPPEFTVGSSSASASRRGLAAVRSLLPDPRWRGLLSPASRTPGFARRVRGLPGSPTLRLAAVCLGGARCGLRPPVSPCRTRRCAVSRRGQLGPGVVSRRERVRLAAARRGCRRAPTGGLSRARPRRPPPARPGGGRWCGE